MPKSSEYYLRIPDNERIERDWLRSWTRGDMVQGHFRNAFGYLFQCGQGQPAEFESLFLADMPVLEKLGYDVKAGRILADKILYTMRMMISG